MLDTTKGYDLVAGWSELSAAFDDSLSLRHSTRNVSEVSEADEPEVNLWHAWLQQKVWDAQGRDGADKQVCQECHLDNIHCGCRTAWIDPAEFPKVEAAYRAKKEWVHVTVHGHIIKATMSRIVQAEGSWWYRRLSTQCKWRHSIQECAQEWFAGDDCVRFCEEWDLSVDYVRRLV